MSSHRDYIYLASPYNHPNQGVRLDRVEKVSKFGFDLTESGLNVFCPITQSFNLQNEAVVKCPIKEPVIFYMKRGRPLTHEEWMRVDLAFLSKAKLLVVYCLHGWKESKGVREEISYAEANGIPIVYSQRKGDFLDQLSQIKVALGLEDVKEGKVQEKEWKATHDFDVARKEILEKFEDYKPPVHEREKMNTILKEVIDDTPPAPQEFPDEFDSVREEYEMLGISDLQKDTGGDPCGNCSRILTTYPSRWPCQANSKGVKAEEAKNKPTTLNFPWEGYDNLIEKHNDTRDYIGSEMAALINAVFHTGYFFNILFNLEQAMLLYTTNLQVNEVFVKGMQKHGLRTHLNYDRVDIKLLVDAVGRHILKGLDNLDEESGIPHAAHVLANIYMIRQILNKASDK